MLSCSQLTFLFSIWSPSSASVTAAQPDFPPTSQTITSKSPCWSIFLWFPPMSCVFPGFHPLPCTLLILYTILGWPHHHPDLFSSLSPCMLMVLPRSESTYKNSSGPQNPHRLRAMGHLHSDVPQALQICRWPQTYTPCLVDACYHSPNSLTPDPGDAARCALHPMIPLDLLWKRLNHDFHIATVKSLEGLLLGRHNLNMSWTEVYALVWVWVGSNPPDPTPPQPRDCKEKARAL